MNATIAFNSTDKVLKENSGKVIAFSIICLSTVIGNCLIILSVKVEPRLKSVSNYFIINLAVADAAVGLTCQPFLSIWEIYDFWPYSDLICDLWISFDYLFCSSSFLSMCAISMDRYWSLLVETKLDINRNRRSRKRAVILIASTWLIPSLVWVPGVFINRKIYGPSLSRDCQYKANSGFIVTCCILFYYVPMIAMLIFYLKIYRSLHNQMHKLSIWLTEMDLEFIRSLSNPNLSETVTNISVLSKLENLNYLRQYSQMSAVDAVSAAVVVAAAAQHHQNARHKRRSRKRRVPRRHHHHKSRLSSIFGNNKVNKNHTTTHHQHNPEKELDGSCRSSTSQRNSSSKYSTSIFGATTSSSFEIFNGLRMLASFRKNSKKNKQQQKNKEPAVVVVDANAAAGAPSAAKTSVKQAKTQNRQTLPRPTNGRPPQPCRDIVHASLIEHKQNDKKLNGHYSSAKLPKTTEIHMNKEAGNSNRYQNASVRLLDSNNRLKKYASTTMQHHHHHSSRRRSLNWPRNSSYHQGLCTKNLPSITITGGLSSTSGGNNLTRQMSITSGQNQQKLRLLKQQRVAKMIGVLIFVFLVCWVPITILTPIQVLCNYCISKRLYYNIVWCKYLNSSINFYLYMLSNKDFRYGLRRIMNRCVKKRRR